MVFEYEPFSQNCCRKGLSTLCPYQRSWKYFQKSAVSISQYFSTTLPKGNLTFLYAVKTRHQQSKVHFCCFCTSMSDISRNLLCIPGDYKPPPHKNSFLQAIFLV